MSWVAWLVFFALFSCAIEATEDLSNGRVLFRYDDTFSDRERDRLSQHFDSPVGNSSQWAFIHLPFHELSHVRDLVSYFLPNLKVGIDERLDQLILFGSQEDVFHVRLFVSSLEGVPKLFEVLVVAIEINEDEYQQYESFFSSFLSGIKINFDGGGPVSFLTSDNTWSYLMKTGKARLIAQPLIVVENNKKGTLSIGHKLPYSTSQSFSDGVSHQIHYLDTGIDVEVTARLVSANRVAADFSLNVSSLKQWKSIGDSTVPELATRRIQTHLFSDLNSMGLIASMENERFMENRKEPSFFSRIPWVGDWFVTDSNEHVKTVILFFSVFKLVK